MEIKTVLITGASSGIGHILCQYLLSEGYFVVATGRSIGKLRCSFEETALMNPNLKLAEMDVSDSRDIVIALNKLRSDGISVDVLVNNAGYGLTGLLETMSTDEISSQFQTNVFGLMEVTRNVLPSMKKRNMGKVINIGSVLGRFSVPWNGAYSASKFAVEGFSESLRYELHGTGIYVSVIEPGLFDTKFRDNQIRSKGSIREYATPKNNYLKIARRRGSDPVKIAHLVSKIITTRHPKLRYVVGWDAQMALFLKGILPSRVFEYLVWKFTRHI